MAVISQTVNFTKICKSIWLDNIYAGYLQFIIQVVVTRHVRIWIYLSNMLFYVKL